MLTQDKQCDRPSGCHIQDHSINWRKFSEYEMDMLDFLRLNSIAPSVFENDQTETDTD